jgi:hypothetical protein
LPIFLARNLSCVLEELLVFHPPRRILCGHSSLPWARRLLGTQ